jgi:hypothetical protein
VCNVPAGVWHQADGNMVLWYPYWESAEPDGGLGEGCVAMHLDKSNKAGKWYDASCSHSTHYICDRPGK